MPTVTIDEFSLTTVPIDIHFNEQLLSSATAFTWEHHDKHYLITNWHNVSGRNPNTVSVCQTRPPNRTFCMDYST